MSVRSNARASVPALFVIMLGVLVFATDALAQNLYNRRARNIAILPVPTGGFDVHVFWEFTITEAAQSGDYATTAELNINGILRGQDSVDLQLPSGGGFCSDGPNCQGACGDVSIDGETATLMCIPGAAAGDCACGIVISTVIPGVALTPGDEVVVILRPATGAAPEQDTSDDSLTHLFQGPAYWNRRLLDVDIVPPSVAGSFFDIIVQYEIEMVNINIAPDLRANLEVTNAGGMTVNVVSSCLDSIVLANPCLGAICDNTCGNVMCDGRPDDMNCVFIPGEFGVACACVTPPITDLIPGVRVPPGGGGIILKPAPGALPELPGFPEDDEGEINPCPSDLNGDTIVNGNDLLILLNNWGPCANIQDPMCPGDINADDIINGLDLLILLNDWGPCFPV